MRIVEDIDLLGRCASGDEEKNDEEEAVVEDEVTEGQVLGDLPIYIHGKNTEDNLDRVSVYLCNVKQFDTN